jgi:ribosome biogenesis GTPase
VNEIRDDDSKGRNNTHRQLILLDMRRDDYRHSRMRELGMWDVSQGSERRLRCGAVFRKCKFKDCKHQKNRLRSKSCHERGELRLKDGTAT